MRVWARPLGYLSLHEQRKVTRCRAASGIIAVKASPQAISFNPWIPASAGMTNERTVRPLSRIHALRGIGASLHGTSAAYFSVSFS